PRHRHAKQRNGGEAVILPAPRDDEGEAIGEPEAGDDDLGVAIVDGVEHQEGNGEARRADCQPRGDRQEIVHAFPPERASPRRRRGYNNRVARASCGLRPASLCVARGGRLSWLPCDSSSSTPPTCISTARSPRSAPRTPASP